MCNCNVFIEKAFSLNPKDLNMISHIWNVWKKWKGHESNPDRGWITFNKTFRIIERVFDWNWWEILVLVIQPLRG